MITIVGIELSVSNIEITLLILVIYESSLLCLFLVNGILLMSSLSFNYRIFPYSFSLVIINNWLVGFVLERWIFCLSLLILQLLFQSLNFIPSNCWITNITNPITASSFGIFFVYLFQSINYLDSNSSVFLYFPFSLSLSLFINIGHGPFGFSITGLLILSIIEYLFGLVFYYLVVLFNTVFNLIIMP